MIDVEPGPHDPLPATRAAAVTPQAVLIADDDGVTRAMVGSWLADAGLEVFEARDGVEALALARRHALDLLLVDVTMPGCDGFEVCRELHAGDEESPPVIFLTAHGDTNSRVTGLDAGAVDYIVKPFEQAELMARVRAALRTKAIRDTLAVRVNAVRDELAERVKVVHDELMDLASTDVLTGLLNRRELDARADEAVALARRHGRALSCLVLDLDHFKEVNDLHGHGVGDQVLRETGRRLSAACRISDVVARYGGEEFVLLLPETPPQAAVVLADKLRATLAEAPLEAGDALISIRVSIGVAALTEAMATPADLIAAADEALYRAKRLGRDRTELHVPLGAPA